MNQKQRTITDLRWGCVPYTSGSGLHIGCGPARTFPNAIGMDTERGAAVDLLMQLDRFPLFADGAYDFVVLGDAQRRVKAPRVQLAEAWRVLGTGGFLILVQPTDTAIDWLRADAADYVVHPRLHLGSRHVDVVQKLPAGEGRHEVHAADAEKTCAVVRPGGWGDALWATSILPALKREGYHVTVYTERQGEEILRHDPNADALIVTDELRVPLECLGQWWAHEQFRYDRWINLVESVEKNLIAVTNDLRFFWPDTERRRIFGRNYLEAVHDLAGVPRQFGQRFHATPDETAWARQARAHAGRAAVIAPTGSTLPKFWPWTDALADALVAKGYHVWVLGDLRDRAIAPRCGVEVIGTDWPMRQAIAFAQQADVVIGEETAITNAVAFEAMRKVVLLSHSTARNLTQHWKNTVALHGDVPCWPCHRIHYTQHGWHHCNLDQAAGAARCQSTIGVEQVMAAVAQAFVVRQAA